MSRFKIALAIALFAILFAWIGRGNLRPVDNWFYDVGLTSRPPQKPEDIVLLGIDEAFMTVDGAPLSQAPRDRLATLIRNVAEGHPKAIALDVWLDTRVDARPDGVDSKLRAALAYAKKLKVPVVLSDVPPSQTEFDSVSENGQTTHNDVLPYFSEVAQTGSVIFRPDADGRVRWHTRDISRRPSSPVLMAKFGGAKQDDLLSAQLGHHPINFCGPPGTIPGSETTGVPRAIDFLEPGTGLLLADQLVFIGAVFPRSRDFLFTPYSQVGNTPMYGVELLAQATQDIRQGLPRQSEQGSWNSDTDLLFAFLLSLLVALAALRATSLGLIAALLGLGLTAFCALLSASQTTALWDFRFHAFSPFLVALPLSAGGGIAWRSVIEGRELRRVRDTFGAYVGAQVLESLGGKMPELGGETRRIAVLFCDIRGYSALAESMNNDPKALLDELNRHFAPLVAALQRRGAYVDNYVGDLVMALFGAPVSTGNFEKDVRASVLAALDFVNIIETRNVARREQGLFPIEVGIGVHCGEAVVGNMGSTDAQDGGKIHYTAIGDVVNVASRIESATRGQNVALLVTREVVEVCGQGEGIPAWEHIGEVQVKGRAAPVDIYKVARA